MLKSYFKIALRTIKRQKAYALINVVGLSTGIMACLIILLYVRDASSYESFYKDSDKIYRLSTLFSNDGTEEQLAILPARVVELSYNAIPETEHVTLLNNIESGLEVLIEVGEQKFVETEFFSADSSFFKVFQRELLFGDFENALSDPKGVVLSEEGALKYFGRTDVITETIKINASDRFVSAVVKAAPGKTVLNFNILLPTVGSRGISTQGWFPMNYPMFATFSSLEKANQFVTKLNEKVEEEVGEMFRAEGTSMQFSVEPISEMYFNTSMQYDFNDKLPKNLMYSLIVISLFILVIACINYINLSTAKSEKRAKEVGIRKVMGAFRNQLVWQFYGETFLITLISVVIGVVMTEVLLGSFNRMIQADLSLDLLGDPMILIGLVAITILVSALSGSYPANFLSSFNPIAVLKGASSKGGNSFRRVLVTLQFVISVFLIVGTITISKQLRYIQNKELGFEREQIVYFKMSDYNIRRVYESLRSRFSNIPGVEAVTGSNNMISNVRSGYGAFMEGLSENQNISFRGQNGDEEFSETMGMELLAGESFRNRSDLDSTVYYLINETGAKALGLTAEEAVGKRFGVWSDKMGLITGVVKDFHLNSIHSEIEPWAVFTGPDKYMSYIFTRVDMNRLESIKASMKDTWEELVPTFPFEMFFLDDSVRAAYEKDRQLGKLIVSFTVLAIIIGCLGLFGLASYLAEKRTKEIGIRKVLGANVGRIVFLLSKEYLKIIIISNLIAWPLAFYFMDQWLQTFAYRISVNWTIFLLAAVATALVAGITVSYQSIKAAISNPVNALRNE